LGVGQVVWEESCAKAQLKCGGILWTTKEIKDIKDTKDTKSSGVTP